MKTLKDVMKLVKKYEKERKDVIEASQIEALKVTRNFGLVKEYEEEREDIIEAS